MQDAESKVALLSYYVEGVARIACAIPILVGSFSTPLRARCRPLTLFVGH